MLQDGGREPTCAEGSDHFLVQRSLPHPLVNHKNCTLDPPACVVTPVCEVLWCIVVHPALMCACSCLDNLFPQLCAATMAEERKDTSAGDVGTLEGDAAFMDLYSRQIGAYGIETMAKVSGCAVSGCGRCGSSHCSVRPSSYK